MIKIVFIENMFLYVEEKRGIREFFKKILCFELYNIKSIVLFLKFIYGMRKLGSLGCVFFCKNENIIVFVISCGFLFKLLFISLIFIGDFLSGLFCFFFKFLIIRLFLIITFILLCYIFRFFVRKNVKYKYVMRFY